jgi:CheY-specific phosphatase CheX
MSIKFFGQFLLEKNVITPEQLLEAVKYQEAHNLRFGDYAQTKGYITKEDIVTILREQKRIDMQFGEIAVKLNILTPAQVEEILTLQRNDHVLIGQALVRKGFLTEETLDRELVLFKKEQSQYAPGEVVVPPGLDNPDIVRDVVDLTQKMLRRLSNLTVKAEHGSVGNDEPRRNDVTIVVRFSGSLAYDYVFSASRAVSELITSGVIGEDSSGESQEVIVDGVKEFCNIVCGNIIAKMAQKGKTVSISAPEEVVVSGGGYHIVKGRKAISFTLSSASGDMTLILVHGT